MSSGERLIGTPQHVAQLGKRIDATAPAAFDDRLEDRPALIGIAAQMSIPQLHSRHIPPPAPNLIREALQAPTPPKIPPRVLNGF